MRNVCDFQTYVCYTVPDTFERRKKKTNRVEEIEEKTDLFRTYVRTHLQGSV